MTKRTDETSSSPRAKLAEIRAADRVSPALHLRRDVVGQRVAGEILQRLLDIAVGDAELGVRRGRLWRRQSRHRRRLSERQPQCLLPDPRRLRQILVECHKPFGDLLGIARIVHLEMIAQHVIER